MFPSIVDEQERLNYKQEFDQDHHEYKSLQAELDNINQNLAELDRKMERHPEGSPQFLVSVAGPDEDSEDSQSTLLQITSKICGYDYKNRIWFR